MPNEAIKFTVGGPVQVKEGIYLPRSADKDLFEACRAGEFSYVLACRQIGKSSLMYATSDQLRQEGIRTVLIDLNKIGQKVTDAERWYFSLLDLLGRDLGLEVDLEAWWDNKERVSLIQRFVQFLHDVVLTAIKESIVIFVDEIDMTLGLDFTDDFFIAIRTIYNDRAQYPDYRRLTFVLLGMATPDELIKDDKRTPFNIGQAIDLRDFTPEECVPFRSALTDRYPKHAYFEQIYTWTGGHPYLTQKLSRAVLEQATSESSDFVEKMVEQLFLKPERADDNLIFVQRSVETDRSARKMLRVYDQVLRGEGFVEDDEKSIAINRLKLYGLVITQNGQLVVRNKIYAQVCDRDWTNKMLENNHRQGIPKHYKFMQELGRGGFAMVYLVQNTLDSDKIVALKVLDLRDESEHKAAELLERFEREASATAKLNHPNIIRILETGQRETGRGDTLYIAMEYISGGTLREKLKKEGRLRRDEAMRIVKQIGAALSYAHEQGIIHRDIKPENILLDTSEESLQSVLTDFGLVKDLAPGNNRKSITTGAVGTMGYMAPEQLAPGRWKQESPTPATDLYALAISFFEMLAGQHPFEADSDHELTNPELINKHLSNPLPPLSSIVPEVGSVFDEILSKATAKNPADRFESVAHFIEKLEEANDEANRNRVVHLIEAAKGYFIQDHNPDDALMMLERALYIHPKNVEALRLKGRINFDQGQLEKSLELYRQVCEQTNDPSSEACQDYLMTLIQAADISWHNRAYQEAIAHYEEIRQFRDGHEAQETPVQVWTDTLSKLIEDRHNEGYQIYNNGHPDNIFQAIERLERRIQVLQKLGASQESQDLHEKLTHLQIKRHYDEGIEAYDAGTPEDIGEATAVLKRKIKTLEVLKAEPELEVLRKKLELLQIEFHYQQGVIAFAEGNPANITEAIAILENEQQALVKLGVEQKGQELQGKLEILQVKYHYNRGKHVYANGSPDDIIEATKKLEIEIQALTRLGADQESQEIRGNLKQLQVKVCQDKIKIAETAINNLTTQHEFKIRDILQHYKDIDATYQQLIELEPENEQWQTKQLEKLRVQVQWRKKFADTAEAVRDYESALRHYWAMLNIKTKYGEITQELKLNLKQKVRELEEKADYDRSYNEIQSLIDDEKYAEALKQLENDFIKKGYYEHRDGDVARLFWGLVHAKLNEGEFPPAWGSSLIGEVRSVQEEKSGSEPRSEKRYTAPVFISFVVILFWVIGGLMGTKVGMMIAPYTQNIPYLNVVLFIFIIIALLLSLGAYKVIEGMKK